MNTPSFSGVHRFSAEFMTTPFEVLFSGIDSKYAKEASEAVFEEIGHLEKLLNRHDPTSEISRINRLEPGEEMRIGWEIFSCLDISFRLSRQTAGAFDINTPSLLKYGRNPFSRMWKGRRREAVPPVELIRKADGFSAVRPDRESSPPDLDLGGIGKGFALDSLRPILADWEIPDALIHGGTSTALAMGRPDPEQAGWPVGVGGGEAYPSVPKRVHLRNRALSGSGLEVKGAHITDPRTGKSACRHTAAWVSHPSAAESDALSTAFIVMSDREIDELCRKRPEIWALTIGRGGTYRLYNPDALKENTMSLEETK